jgi:hypothetical protein
MSRPLRSAHAQCANIFACRYRRRPQDVSGVSGLRLATVVFVSALKGSAEDWNIAKKQAPMVFAEVAKFTRVCAYDRPGTPVGEKPRFSRHSRPGVAEEPQGRRAPRFVEPDALERLVPRVDAVLDLVIRHEHGLPPERP